MKGARCSTTTVGVCLVSCLLPNIVGWEPFGSLRHVTQIVETSLFSLISVVPTLKVKLQTSTSKLIYTPKISITHK